MTVGLYSIHDRLAESYSTPMPIPDKIVMRQLQYIISDMTRLDVQDKECVKIGTWDGENGQLQPMKHEVVADLSKLKEQQEGGNG